VGLVRLVWCGAHGPVEQFDDSRARIIIHFLGSKARMIDSSGAG